MTQSCSACGRTNTLQRTACIYCGQALEGAGPNNGPTMPDDLDQLVRQAMTLGTTAHLEKAFAQVEDVQAEGEDEQDVLSRKDLLARLATAARDAVGAEAAGEEARLAEALARARSALAALPAAAVTTTEQRSPTPVVMLPKVRRRFSLVVDGVGDVEAHTAFVEHLQIDAVTARMIARARHPRVAIRSDNEKDLRARAETLSKAAAIKAVVVSPTDLTELGPAHLLASFESGPETVEVHDWTADLHALMERESREPLDEMPRLIVAGELVFQRYRAAPSGGRLKHLREARLDAGRQVRLQVVDLHLSKHIVRILEGASDLAHAPGASEDGFHRTLSQMLEAWSSEGYTVLTSRTLEPSGPDGPLDELGGVLAHPWAQWEEHSRSSRLLYFDE